MRAVCLVAVEAPGGAAVAVVVAGHHDRRLLVARQEPEARQRPAVAVHLPDQVREQVLLLVGLRDRDLVEVHPVGLGIAGGMPEEQVVGADRRRAVALLAGPRRVALARLDDRLGEVVGERGGVAAVAADAAHRHRGVGGRRVRVRVEAGDRLGAAVCRVAVGASRGIGSSGRRCRRPGPSWCRP